MNITNGAVRVLTTTTEATTAVAGAIGGAAINGVAGGVQGTLNGIRSGMTSGSHSTPAAGLTLVALGAAGWVDWPLLLGIGATALVVNQLNDRDQSPPTLTAAPGTLSPPRRAPSRKKTANPTKSAARTPTNRRRRSPANR